MTNYHKLKGLINKLEDWQLEKDERSEITDLIDKMYSEHLKQHKLSNKQGDYGLKYYTIHDDSSYYDEHKIFFTTKEERDSVYEDWGKGLYWDEMFNQELPYRTPGQNYNHEKTVKIDFQFNQEWVVVV